MKRIGISFAAVALALAAQAGSATEQNCTGVSDIALLARALAEEKVDKPRAHSILRRMYEIPDEPARRLASLVVESAYRDTSSASEFALKLEAVCRVNQGDLASLLNAAPRPGRSKVM
jgi:hypothetical protein